MKTVVGLFNTTAEAQEVRDSLIADGYESSHVKLVANDYDDSDSSVYEKSTDSSSAYGIGHKISEFFSSLTGGDNHAHGYYANGVNQGGALLAVTTSDEEASEVAALLKDAGARDIDRNYGDAVDSGTPVYGASSTGTLEDSTSIPIVEEELVVGKREVDRGGVRIYSHVVEHPVSADVTLHNESVSVQRRAVDRPATAADFETGSGSFELRATGEEPVVGKTSRVVEEVVIGKQSSEHTEAISDTVRKTKVDVENVPADNVRSKAS